MQTTTHLFAACALMFIVSGGARGEDWPRFRGPNGRGVSSSTQLPSQLPVQSARWKVSLGQGTSSPVIADGKLYLTSFADSVRTLHCLAADSGQTLWTASVTKLRDEVASRPNGPATCTAAVGSERVAVLYPDTGLFCYSTTGKLLWHAEVGPFHSMHGVAGSPVIAGGKVLLQADQLSGSYLAAFDLETGTQAWRIDRLDGLTGAYSTPGLLTTKDGSLQIVATGPHQAVGYRIADGSQAWSVQGVTNAPVSVPIIDGQRVFLCEPVGEETPLSMLAAMDKNKDGKYDLDEVKGNVPIYRLLAKMDTQFGNGDGVVVEDEWNKAFGEFVSKGGLVALEVKDTDQAAVKWAYRKTVPYVPSILLYDNVLYFVQDGGIVTSVDPDSGEQLKRARLKKGGIQFYASPVAADGKLFLIDTTGQLTVLKAGTEWEELSSQALGERCFATPAICEGRVYIRTARTLFCF